MYNSIKINHELGTGAVTLYITENITKKQTSIEYHKHTVGSLFLYYSVHDILNT